MGPACAAGCGLGSLSNVLLVLGCAAVCMPDCWTGVGAAAGGVLAGIPKLKLGAMLVLLACPKLAAAPKPAGAGFAAKLLKASMGALAVESGWVRGGVTGKPGVAKSGFGEIDIQLASLACAHRVGHNHFLTGLHRSLLCIEEFPLLFRAPSIDKLIRPS